MQESGTLPGDLHSDLHGRPESLEGPHIHPGLLSSVEVMLP